MLKTKLLPLVSLVSIGWEGIITFSIPREEEEEAVVEAWHQISATPSPNGMEIFQTQLCTKLGFQVAAQLLCRTVTVECLWY